MTTTTTCSSVAVTGSCEIDGNTFAFYSLEWLPLADGGAESRLRFARTAPADAPLLARRHPSAEQVSVSADGAPVAVHDTAGRGNRERTVGEFITAALPQDVAEITVSVTAQTKGGETTATVSVSRL